MNQFHPEGQRPESERIPLVIYIALGLLLLEGLATVGSGMRKEDLFLTASGVIENGFAVAALLSLSRLRR